MRTRQIKADFFSDERVVALPFATRILFIGLWTIADREGRLEDKPQTLKMLIFPGDSIEVEPMLRQLNGQGLIQRYEVGGRHYIFIRGFLRHQRVHPKEAPSRCPPPPPDSDHNGGKSLTGGISGLEGTPLASQFGEETAPRRGSAAPRCDPDNTKVLRPFRKSEVQDPQDPSSPQAFRDATDGFSTGSAQPAESDAPEPPPPQAKVHPIRLPPATAKPGGVEKTGGAEGHASDLRARLTASAEAWVQWAHERMKAQGVGDQPGKRAREWIAYTWAKYELLDDAAMRLAFDDFLAWCSTSDPPKRPGWGLWIRDEVWEPRFAAARVERAAGGRA